MEPSPASRGRGGAASPAPPREVALRWGVVNGITRLRARLAAWLLLTQPQSVGETPLLMSCWDPGDPAIRGVLLGTPSRCCSAEACGRQSSEGFMGPGPAPCLGALAGCCWACDVLQETSSRPQRMDPALASLLRSSLSWTWVWRGLQLCLGAGRVGQPSLCRQAAFLGSLGFSFLFY